MLYKVEQPVFYSAFFHLGLRLNLIFFSFLIVVGLALEMEILVHNAGLGHTKQKVAYNSTRACQQSSSLSIGQESWLVDPSLPLWSQHVLPSFLKKEGGLTQHFGLISLHRCCSVSLPASFGSTWCLLGPLTVGCHNNIRQRRETWQSCGWARWRGGGSRELSHSKSQVPLRTTRRQVAIGKEYVAARTGWCGRSTTGYCTLAELDLRCCRN